MLVTSIIIDGKQFDNAPMVLAPLGRYDIILGRNWLTEQVIWLDVKHRSLVWPQQPDELPSGEQQPTSTEVMDVAMLSPLAFTKSVRRNPEQCFKTTHAEIEAVLENEHNPENLVNEQRTVREEIPPEYHQSLDVFSERESDRFSPRRPSIDMKINLAR